MQTKGWYLLAGAVVLMGILFTGYAPVEAAPPAGEVKIVAPEFGDQVPIPYIEGGRGKDWFDLLFDHLVGVDSQGKFSSDIGLANKWEMSPDGTTWTFYLRKGVKFHDGVELTSKDVKFSIEQHRLPDATNPESGFIRKTVTNIDAKDPYKVVIQCKEPAIFLAQFLSNMESSFGQIVPKDYYEKVGKDGFIKHPIGSGPYRWHSQQVGASIKLEATEKHWRDGVPRYKYMTFIVIPEESTRLAMLRTGEADIARVSREAVKDAKGAGLNLVAKENAGVVVFILNMQWASPVFSDVRFRKALNLAIDKEAIIKQLFVNLAKPLGGYPGSHAVAFGGDLTLKPYPYDPQEARRLIKEGGWEGHEFALVSYPRAGCPEYPLVVEALAGYWQKIGLKPNIRISEWSVWRKAWGERKTQNTINGYDDSLAPDLSGLVSKFEDKWFFGNPRSSANIPALNERFEKMRKSRDVAEISKLMREIYGYAYDQYLMIPICQIPDMIATTKRIPQWDPGIRRQDRNYSDLIRQR